MNMNTTIMNKKNLLLLFVGILSGVFFVYAGAYLTSKPKTSQTASKSDETSLPSSYLEEKQPLNNKGNSPVNLVSPEKDHFLECLYQYSQMTPENIRKEWLNLYQGIDTSNASNFHKARRDYLILKRGRALPIQTIQELKTEPYENDSLIRIIMKNWVIRDPETALPYILKNKNDFKNYDTVDILATHAPLDLIKWVKSAPREKSSLLLEHAIDALPGEQMANLISGMGKCDMINFDYCRNIASKWAEIDLEASVRWIDSLTHLEKEEIQTILQDILSTLPPDKAISEMEKRGMMDKISNLHALTYHLPDKSGEKRLDWFLSQVTDEEIESLGDKDSPLSFANAYDPQMISYALQLPPGKKKDAILEEMTTKIWYNARTGRESRLDAPSLDMRMDLAAQISTKEKRDATIQIILNPWIYNKPKKVIEWVEKSALPAEKKQQYINQCKMSIKRAEMPYDS